MYVDSNAPEVAPASMHKPAQPKPAQLLFEFDTKGAQNSRATDFLKADVTDVVQKSGAFSDVNSSAVPSGAILNIVVNNIPQEDAASKGFVTGLTLGAAGSTVTDYYTCTATYISSGGAHPIVKEEHDAIYTTIGATSAPPHATKAHNGGEAAKTMIRQVVSHAVDDLAADPAFAK
jgi:hypothetical protein